MFRIMHGLFGSDHAGYAFEPDLNQRHELGLRSKGWSPFWGGGEFVYGKAAAILEMGSLVQSDINHTMTDVPNIGNTGRPFFTALYEMVANEFGWFQCSGVMVLSTNSSVAADTAVGVAAAGMAGANAAGKQILGYHNLQPSTTTVVKTCRVTSGTGHIEIVTGDIRGWFHGVTLSGAGIPVSSEITSINQNLREVTMSENATASGAAVVVTGTYTGFLVGYGSNPNVQGAIT